MGLIQFISGITQQIGQTEQTGQTAQTGQPDPSFPPAIQRELQNLSPGQILSGQILERVGDQVKLMVNMTEGSFSLDAQISQNLALAIGKNVAFQVKSSNTGGLVLSPLFENMGMEENGKKALSMAGIPENDLSLKLVSTLMKEGMSVDRNSLSQYYQQAVSHQNADVMDLIDLNRLGLPVTDENLEQIASYKNLTHQLTGAVSAMAEELPQFLSMVGRGISMDTAMPFLTELFSEGSLIEDGAFLSAQVGEEAAEALNAEGENPPAATGEETVQNSGNLSGEAGAEGLTGAVGTEGFVGTSNGITENPTGLPGGVVGAEMAATVNAAAENTVQAGIPAKIIIAEAGVEAEQGRVGRTEPAAAIREQDGETAGEMAKQSEMEDLTGQGKEMQPGDGKNAENPMKPLFQNLAEGIKNRTLSPQQTGEMLHKILDRPEGRVLLKEQFTRQLSLKPEEAGPEGIKKLYNSLNRQLQNLSQALQTPALQDTGLGRMVQNTMQNMDFLEQMNQMYSYIQLPLKLAGQDANGDLYVYTKKKNLSEKDGEITAFLHLDMQHLGPLDCMVRMEQGKVSTRFTLEDDEKLAFLEKHMDLLTKRLTQRGYQAKVSVHVKDEAEEETDGKNPVLGQLIMEHSNRPMSGQLSFDARA